jgi:hypothetical protein
MCNVGSIDRLIRIIVGAVVLIIGLAGLFGTAVVVHLGTTGNWIAVVIGAVLLLTGVFRFCPAYVPFGWNTDRH